MIDLSNYDVTAAADQGATLILRDPGTGEELYTEEGEPVSIELTGADAQDYRRELKRLANTRINERHRKKESIDRVEADTLGLLVIATKAWKNIALDGEALECSAENVRALYTRAVWVKEQVDEFIGDRSNFLTSA